MIRRGQRQQKGGYIVRSIEPAALWSQDPAARTVVLYSAISKEQNPKIRRTTVPK